MEWRQADVFILIEAYKERKLLWDARVDEFKNRNKRHDAWAEMDSLLSVETGECEKKMRKLISQFNRESKKILKSGRGAETTKNWVYFKPLLFLKDKNTARTSLDGGFIEQNQMTTLDAVDGDESQIYEIRAIEEELLAASTCTEGDNLLAVATKPSSARARAPKRKSNAMAEEAYSVMKGLINNKSHRDEFDSYAEHVAMTLRKLNKISATHAKFEINKILFHAEMGHYEPSSRPVSAATWSSGSNPGTSYNEVPDGNEYIQDCTQKPQSDDNAVGFS